MCIRDRLSGGSNTNNNHQPPISTASSRHNESTDFIKRAESTSGATPPAHPTSTFPASVSPAPRSSSSKRGSRPGSRASSVEKRAATRTASGSNIAVAYEPSSSSVHHVRVEPTPPPSADASNNNKTPSTYYEPNAPTTHSGGGGGDEDGDRMGRIVWSPSGARRQHDGTGGGFKSLTTNPVMPINDRSSQASSHVSAYPTHNMIGVNDNPGDPPRGGSSASQSGLGYTPASRKSSVLSALSRGSVQ
eukprot:TRINITY_DN15766_c0_g1_i2.p1 TRINITY_DN15766_c0_g1~~TRINITY_DN15766_c0_g1_i2.p1  ORF type:complete len:247 (-),score=40.65 TRINITY_DN15766_c0_g1_i2:99-839(-)